MQKKSAVNLDGWLVPEQSAIRNHCVREADPVFLSRRAAITDAGTIRELSVLLVCIELLSPEKPMTVFFSFSSFEIVIPRLMSKRIVPLGVRCANWALIAGLLTGVSTEV